jgi:hypothetical protein
MSASKHFHPPAPLDLSRWRNLPNFLMVGGAALVLLGVLVQPVHTSYAWLLAFMFFLSLALGGLFLVLVHHLFDAGWSVPMRRVYEQMAALLPWLALPFIPVAVLAPSLYPWMGDALQAHPDHALAAKWPLFTKPAFYAIAAFNFGVWWLLATKLRGWSLRQDAEGGAEPTLRLRRWAAGGIFLFAITLTLAAILWMKALTHQWFSTMYGVYYFAGSVWLTLATVYVMVVLLQRTGPLRGLLHEHQYYFLGTLLFAFTVFYAYIAFSQYFIIWNANMPEETFWYKLREQGTWFGISMLLIFGHFFLPFLALLRIDAKQFLPLMVFLALWAWLMHYVDLAFNIMPIPHPTGFPLTWVWIDAGCLALIGGFLAKVFLNNFHRHAPYPIKDPRLCEALGQCDPASPISGGEVCDTEAIEEAMDDLNTGDAPAKGGAR